MSLLELFDQPRDEGARKRCLPFRDTLESDSEPLGVRALREIAAHSSLECGKEIPLARGAREHDDGCIGAIPENRRRRGEAATRELHIYQTDVRSLACRRLDRFRRIGRLGADSAAGILECPAHAGAFARRGVRDEYPDGWATEPIRCSGPAEAVLSAGFGKGLARSHGRNRGPHWTKSRAVATWEGEAVAASPSPLAVSAISLHRIVDGDVAVRDGLARKGRSAPGVRP